ncbi:MAG: CGNR zinc finger domain-containing protein [Solirubrobacterales bacterium]|nr:CGNR zinc finger domain-containing protein [Solirubrobacterales bacterium]
MWLWTCPSSSTSRSPPGRPGGTGWAAGRRWTSSTRCASGGTAASRRSSRPTTSAPGSCAPASWTIPSRSPPRCSGRRASCARRSTPAWSPSWRARRCPPTRSPRSTSGWPSRARARSGGGDAEDLPLVVILRHDVEVEVGADVGLGEEGELADVLDAAHVLGTPERRARLRICASETCSARFYDRSPAGVRRWCSMRTCGNAAKARRHRRRQAVTTQNKNDRSTG